jgi:hypothetical protein
MYGVQRLQQIEHFRASHFARKPLDRTSQRCAQHVGERDTYTPVPPASNADVHRAWNRIGFSSRMSKVFPRSTPFDLWSGINATSTLKQRPREVSRQKFVAECGQTDADVSCFQMFTVSRTSVIENIKRFEAAAFSTDFP